jgi:hypothetical protein
MDEERSDEYMDDGQGLSERVHEQSDVTSELSATIRPTNSER